MKLQKLEIYKRNYFAVLQQFKLIFNKMEHSQDVLESLYTPSAHELYNDLRCEFKENIIQYTASKQVLESYLKEFYVNGLAYISILFEQHKEFRLKGQFGDDIDRARKDQYFELLDNHCFSLRFMCSDLREEVLLLTNYKIPKLDRNEFNISSRYYGKFELLKTPVSKRKKNITAPAIALFCMFVNESGLIPKDEIEDESDALFCQKVCTQYGQIYTDNVRQEFKKSDVKKNRVIVIEHILPKIKKVDREKISKYLANKYPQEQNLYG